MTADNESAKPNAGPSFTRRPALLAIALGLTISFMPGSAVLAQSADSIDETAIDEIIVTGRKRQESIQNVPSSVSVVSGEEFETLGGRNLRDLEFQLANVDFFDQSNLVNNIVSIRGIGTNARSVGLETGTSFYLDGVLLNRPGLFSLTTNDIQAIEVFRGPQGTEFGRNALAGVFYSTSARPTSDWMLRVAAGAGNFDFEEASLVLSGPLIEDVLTVRASYQQQARREGYIRNFEGQDAGTTDQSAGRLSFSLTPGDSTTIDIMVNFATDRIDFNTLENFVQENPVFGPQYGCEYPDVTFTTFPGVGTFEVPCIPVPGPYTVAVADPTFQDVESDGVQINIEHEFANGWTVRSINASYDNETDYTFSLGPGPAASGTSANFGDDAEQFSSEIQLISPVGSADGVPWDVVSGLFYMNEEITSLRESDFGVPSIPVVDENGVPTGEFLQTLSQRGTQDLDSLAVYANGNYYFGNYTLNLGVRASREERTSFLDQDGSIQFFLGRFIERQSTLDEDVVTGTVSLGYDFTDDRKVYAKWARGFKPGGTNLDSSGPTEAFGIPTTFNNESSDLFELGWRSRFSNALTFNFTAFYQIFEDQQNTILLPGNPAIDPGQPDGNIIVNIGDATSRGFELDLQYVPIDRMRLSLAYGYTKAEYDDDQSPSAAVAAIDAVIDGFADGIAGSPLPFSRKHNVIADAAYTFLLGSSGSLMTRANYSYRSSAASATSGSGLGTDPSRILNGFVTWTSPNATYQVEAWARNLTDETYLISVFGNSFTGGAFGGSYNVPREYGMRVRLFFE